MIQKPLFFLIIGFLAATSLFSQSAWPKNIPISDGGKLTMYEPQPESISGDQITGRAAVSVRKSENGEPVFGVVFFTATLQSSGRSGNQISSMRITQAKFSGIEDDGLVDNYSSLLEKNASGWDLGMSDDQLRDAADREKPTTSGADFNNAAPAIVYTNRPSTLIVLDGEPKVSYDKNIDADKVVNSPNLIFREGNQWNLYAGGNWYRSSSAINGWQINNRLSSKVKKVNEAVKKQEKENNKGEAITASPRETHIVVATVPTELLQTDGDPQYKTISGTSLLYVSNSPNEIFKDVNTQKTYILIAGRWYSSSNMNGPWSYVPSDKLPADFAVIPEGSDKDKVLSSVAGTNAAEDARVNAEVPQTAKVDRRTAAINVEYDGTPVFNQIEGTSLDLAENSNVTVMIDATGRYFAMENGIWFVGNSAYGPWKVANDRPRDIDDIPANSPAYNTKYVYVYDETPDYVYMGYTSGYLGSYYYGPTIVYGTGWHYRPWYRSMYYPRPITWGFGFMYDPWYGWGINWGYNYGFLHIGFDYGGHYGYPGYGYGGGWFGPQYYCPPYRRPHYGGYYGRYNDYYGYNGGYYRNSYGYNSRTDRPVNGDGSRPNRRSGAVSPDNNTGSGWSGNNNLYSNQRGVIAQSVNRTPRVYRPDAVNRNSSVSAPVNEHYSNRISSGSGNRTPEIRNNNSSNNGSVTPRTNGIRNERAENPKEPFIDRSERESVIDRQEIREPIINRTEPREPVINRSDNNRRNNSPFERNRSADRQPSNDHDRPEPVRERPVITRPEPAVERERPTQIERPQRVERSLPAPRPAPERSTYNSGSSSPQRAPQSNVGSSSNGGGLQRGGRPGR